MTQMTYAGSSSSSGITNMMGNDQYFGGLGGGSSRVMSSQHQQLQQQQQKQQLLQQKQQKQQHMSTTGVAGRPQKRFSYPGGEKFPPNGVTTDVLSGSDNNYNYNNNYYGKEHFVAAETRPNNLTLNYGQPPNYSQTHNR
jgi:hypothetical protein